MELDTFIKETLLAIHKGTCQALKEIDSIEGTGSINPVLNENTEIQNVEFDVALTVSGKDEVLKKAGGKISIASIGIGGGASTNKEVFNHSITRVKFHIPLRLPHTDDNETRKNNARCGYGQIINNSDR